MYYFISLVFIISNSIREIYLQFFFFVGHIYRVYAEHHMQILENKSHRLRFKGILQPKK